MNIHSAWSKAREHTTKATNAGQQQVHTMACKASFVSSKKPGWKPSPNFDSTVWPC